LQRIPGILGRGSGRAMGNSCFTGACKNSVELLVLVFFESRDDPHFHYHDNGNTRFTHRYPDKEKRKTAELRQVYTRQVHFTTGVNLNPPALQDLGLATKRNLSATTVIVSDVEVEYQKSFLCLLIKIIL
jgi:hypothetical protein